jgi:hypothetical protein
MYDGEFPRSCMSGRERGAETRRRVLAPKPHRGQRNAEPRSSHLAAARRRPFEYIAARGGTSCIEVHAPDLLEPPGATAGTIWGSFSSFTARGGHPPNRIPRLPVRTLAHFACRSFTPDGRRAGGKQFQSGATFMPRPRVGDVLWRATRQVRPKAGLGSEIARASLPRLTGTAACRERLAAGLIPENKVIRTRSHLVEDGRAISPRARCAVVSFRSPCSILCSKSTTFRSR